LSENRAPQSGDLSPEEAERLSKTVSQLMELTQLDSGEIQLEHDVFDLTELVATTADQMKLLAEDKQIQLEVQLSPQVAQLTSQYAASTTENAQLRACSRRSPRQAIGVVRQELRAQRFGDPEWADRCGRSLVGQRLGRGHAVAQCGHRGHRMRRANDVAAPSGILLHLASAM
jgi:signal transduction histidine kinase